ncbi:MAG: aminodeoxychorismate synthase, component I [Comamonadaceae bacterium CG_4_9_14_3_um_filter_60_33]|nr:MAG: aminodeoxychorismate synthase, component I [Comamonadaceae bacterium CG_4_10_14_3_um_filter_60_42]PJB41225.1 MAG: aminodeoxychorismate synthase, component I [Comamonadaceae bacterium CG_4_9_14_3_um_filter_60_33]
MRANRMQVLLDFCDPHGQQAALRCAFDKPEQTLVAHTPALVKPLLEAVDALAKQGFWCVGYVHYEAALAFDDAFKVHATDGPLAWFGVYDKALPWPAETSNDDDATRVQWQSGLSRPDFDAAMDRIHQAIAAGDLYQVNYTAPLHGEFFGDPQTLFRRLHRAQPQGYAAFINSGFEQVLSVSPELFFDWQNGQAGQGGQLLTRPMKGTAPRGNSAAEDATLAAALVASPKERAENVMIVDLLRNDVSRIAQPHSVKVPHIFTVQTLPTVLQMVSDVTAATRPGTTLCDVFGALFPCGSITGAPKVQAMRMIEALEPTPRGVYCGAIGVVRPGGRATFNVAIRTVTLRSTSATCGIGSGITADATAEAEWREWRIKRGFLARASESFKLLETLRLEGGIFHHLEAHLARLKRAAVHFGFPFDEEHIGLTIQHLRTNLDPCGADLSLPWSTEVGPTTSPNTVLRDSEATWSGSSTARSDHRVWRVRLLLDDKGHAQAQAFALPPSPSPVTLQLASRPFDEAHSEFTRFKTTHRAHYEAFAPTDPAVFDTLLHNEAGELTECTRGNVALLLNGRWVTPLLRCGLLDGIGREMYLKEGRLIEAVVRVDDLPRVQALAFINSLRGGLDARLPR